MREMKELIKGHWYIYRAEEGEGVCERCSSMAGKSFIYKGETALPFHPNCRCTVENYQDEMISRIKAVWPSVSYAQLDALLGKEYYKYIDVAIPTYVIGDYHYYIADGVHYKVNLTTLWGVGVLPDGRYIIGADNEIENFQLYLNIKAGIPSADEHTVKITAPLYSGETYKSLHKEDGLVEGESKTIIYFEQQYTGQVRNGELYLDEEGQRRFLKQIELTTADIFGMHWNKYKNLSVSELMRIHGYKSGYKPYDPSKALPTLTEEEKSALKKSGLVGKKAVTDNILLSRRTIDGAGTTVLRFVSTLTTGVVTVTDYYLATKTKDEWESSALGIYKLLKDVADGAETVAPIGNVPVATSFGIVTIPFELIGMAGSAINFVDSLVEPSSAKYLDEVLEGIEKDKRIMLPFMVMGYDAQFDEHGNLSMSYSYEYRFGHQN